MVLRLFVFMISLSAVAYVYAAVDPYEFSSEEHRKRYQHLVEELRCPKCKNNNLAGTNSQIAVDLRRELQKMVEKGDSDEQIIDFMVSRYGDFVLYRPRMTGKTLYVWFGPLILLGIGVAALATILVRRRRVISSEDHSLTDEEQAKLKAILSKKAK